MALDSEPKRWSMLQLANGPSSYSHVINPTGSDFDSQVERLTLLKIYGGDLAADVIAPVLTLPTGVSTGTSTATGTVTTDEGNGTLFFLATVNASETAATIKAGGSQAVSGTGIQNVSFTGLASNTIFFAHYVHDDAASNESNVVSSGSFTTDEDTSRPSGGFWPDYDAYQYKKRKERKRLLELEEQAKRIKDRLDRELALEFRKQEREESRIDELRVLTKLAKEHKEDIEESFSDKVIFAADKAIMKGNYSSMERLEREIARVKEEEWFLLEATRIILNQ